MTQYRDQCVGSSSSSNSGGEQAVAGVGTSAPSAPDESLRVCINLFIRANESTAVDNRLDVSSAVAEWGVPLTALATLRSPSLTLPSFVAWVTGLCDERAASPTASHAAKSHVGVR